MLWFPGIGNTKSDSELFLEKQSKKDIKNGINSKGGSGHLMKPGKNYSKRKKKKK